MKVSMVRGASVLWLFLSTYALLYGAFGVQSPFVPALLGERGLPTEDIGLVLAAAMIVRARGSACLARRRLAATTHVHTVRLRFVRCAGDHLLSFGTQSRGPALRRAPSCRYAGADRADHRCVGLQGSARESGWLRPEVRLWLGARRWIYGVRAGHLGRRLAGQSLRARGSDVDQQRVAGSGWGRCAVTTKAGSGRIIR